MNVKNALSKLKDKLPKSKSTFLIIAGILGLLLVLVSTFADKKTVKDKEALKTVNSQNNLSATEKYIETVENKLETVISDMLSNTPVTVMVTLESGIEYVYADELKTGVETKKDNVAYKTEQSDSNQNNYVIFKDSDGNEQALLVTEIMPEIRGVVIVCDSGQTAAVSAAVKRAVKSVLNVDENKICVIGRY